MISIGQSLMIFGLDIAGFEWKTSHESTDDISTTLSTLSTNCITIKRMLNLKKKTIFLQVLLLFGSNIIKPMRSPLTAPSLRTSHLLVARMNTYLTLW